MSEPEMNEVLAVLDFNLAYKYLEFDDTVTQLIDFVLMGSAADHQRVRAKLSSKHFVRLVGYAMSMAQRAVRQRSIQDVERGLVACALEGGRDDFRDTIVALSLLHRSAVKLGAEPDRLFERASAVGDHAAADFLLQYLATGEKCIGKMGYVERLDENGNHEYVSMHRLAGGGAKL